MNMIPAKDIRAKLHEAPGKRGEPSYWFSYNLHGARIRSCRFKDRQVAEFEMGKVIDQYEHRTAYQRTDLSPQQCKDAEAAFSLLRGKTTKALADIVAWYLSNYRDKSVTPLLSEATALFQATLSGRRATTRHEYKKHFESLNAHFPGKRIGELTTADFNLYLAKANWGSVTRDHHRRTAAALYNWAMEQVPPLVDHNPLKGIKALDLRTALKEVQVFSVPEAKKMLTNARNSPVLPYLALGLFAGLRREEIVRLAAEPQGGWEFINLKLGTIRLPVRLQKRSKQDRTIAIRPALKKWLEYCKRKGFTQFTPPNFNKLWKALKRASLPKGKWNVNNLGRHSFISFNLKLSGASYATISRECGNSETIIRGRYEAVQVSEKDAKAYFSLFP